MGALGSRGPSASRSIDQFITPMAWETSGQPRTWASVLWAWSIVPGWSLGSTGIRLPPAVTT